MKKVFLLVAGCLILVAGGSSQTVATKMQEAYGRFTADSQLRHAISSLYVIDAKTGEVVFDKNSQIGLAPASTQKIITSVTAYELLGKEYRYRTEFGRTIGAEKELALWINPSGDPTFGSWRWESTNEKRLLGNLVNEINKNENARSSRSIYIKAIGWELQDIPERWIWQDIGNYYGASANVLNWRENQYELILKSGTKVRDPVTVVKTNPKLYSTDFNSKVTSAKKGSGDNAYIYLPINGSNAVVKGTIPVDETEFSISGSIANPAEQFSKTLEDALRGSESMYTYFVVKDSFLHRPQIFYTHYSPPLDSIIYWFNKKSINLYGEALIKTFAYEKQGFGSTDSGVAILKKFWKEKGLDDEELNMYDGSGLSPMNRVTTHAQVEILKFAISRPWFSSFYHSLPEYNGMKIKSGTIGDVKGFCGYHTAKDGKEYIVSFLVNNYAGRSSTLVGKMYKVLDELK